MCKRDMKTLLIATILVWLMIPTQIYSQESEKINKAKDDMAIEYAVCAAYFRLVYFALESSNKQDAAKKYRKIEDAVMLYSLLLANQGRDQDTAVEVTNSRIEFNMKLMKQEIRNRNENISILMNMYQLSCIELLNNPSDMVKEVVNRYR